MLIKKIEVENFRCLEKATLECDSLTILVGPNGVGKSTFLRALEVFYTPNFPITPDDFSNNQTQKPVKIRVTFGELTEAEKEQFKSYLRDEELVVEKVIKYSEEDNKFHSEYHGIVKGIKDFEDLRRLRTVSEKREKYTELRNIKYPELPDLGSSPTAERIDEELRNWEN
jgi:putative ATP-dependent endonuclease of OLD family